jgi:hypothetical protein
MTTELLASLEGLCPKELTKTMMMMMIIDRQTDRR